MRRAGGWILGLIVVTGMAAAAMIGLRPILFRKKVTIAFNSSVQWTALEEKGVRLAFEERNSRAGSFRVEPAFVNQAKREEHNLKIDRSEALWEVVGPRTPPSDPKRLYFYPQDSAVGSRTAQWARRSEIKSVFLLRSASFEAGFEKEATAAGLRCRSEFLNPQGRSLVEGVLAAEPELVILNHPVLPVVTSLRKAGYSGKFLVYDPDFEPAGPAGASTPELEGVFLAALFVPIPSASRKFAGLTEYHGYRMANLVLDAIERAESDDQAAIYRALASSPEFASDGTSTLPGGLYVVRKGALEFVEPLK
jgi:hypothetical protein